MGAISYAIMVLAAQLKAARQHISSINAVLRIDKSLRRFGEIKTLNIIGPDGYGINNDNVS
jgi:hypothetical protein